MPDSYLQLFPTEILILITDFLRSHDLAQCALASKTWHNIFIPFLYHAIRILPQHNIAFDSSPERLVGFSRYGHLTRILKTTQVSVAQSFATSTGCANLETPRYQIRGRQSPEFQLEEQRAEVNPLEYSQVLCRLLQKNPGLRSLVVGGERFYSALDLEDLNEVLVVIPHINLLRLEIAFDGSPDLKYPPIYNSARIAAEPLKEIFASLKELVITDIKVGQYGELSFKKYCVERYQAVESIKIYNGRVEVPAFLDALWTSCQLNRLGFSSYGDESDATIRFGLTAAYELLRNHTATLEVLKCDSWNDYHRDDLAYFLRNAQRLVRLESVQDGSWLTYISELRLDALSMASASKDPWSLGKSVEYFQLRIGNFPRLDVICQIDGRLRRGDAEQLDVGGTVWPDDGESMLPVDFTKSYEVQRWVYTQLGRMTGLKVLNLGVPDTSTTSVIIEASMLGIFQHPGSQLVREFNYQSLEFSLESGLGLLAGLKELQVLDVCWTAHRIGVEELKWMHTNWPNLKSIKGLYVDRGWTGDEEGNEARRIAVDQWMAAHPKGIGSSFYFTAK
ncbi:hypothetical protein EC991_007906 [Linnemannia zychae]|nr:hypothetical protein EC991_007906 [Linnemannia zychae]